MFKWRKLIRYIRECRKLHIPTFHLGTTMDEIVITPNIEREDERWKIIGQLRLKYKMKGEK